MRPENAARNKVYIKHGQIMQLPAALVKLRDQL